MRILKSPRKCLIISYKILLGEAKKWIIFKRTDFTISVNKPAFFSHLLFKPWVWHASFPFTPISNEWAHHFDPSSAKCVLALYNHSGKLPYHNYSSSNTCTSNDLTISLLSVYPKEMHTSVRQHKVLECSS